VSPMAESATAAPPAPLLEMTGIDKSFPGVRALAGVDLVLHPGEVLAVVGENGAGKSTLMKILGGAYLPDSGRISLNGKETRILNPVDARRGGVAVIYQEFNLIPRMTVRENIFLGRERTRLGFFDRRSETDEVKRIFERIGVRLDPEAECGDLSVAQQQTVEIAKALSLDARIIVMDEPTAALTDQEVERLFEIIRDLKSNRIGVIYISHRLDEVFRIADTIMVLRDGQLVGARPVSQFNRQSVIEMMVGRRIENEFPKREAETGGERLVIRNLTRGTSVGGVSFSVRAGEILGLTGLVGSGRTELARLIFGADAADSGSISLDGRELRIRSPKDAISCGICLLTEDRKTQGLVLDHSVRDNFGLPNLSGFSTWGFVREREESEALAGFVEKLRIKIPHHEEVARNLSGGNQQKVVLAKWLQRDCKVIIFDEPTRGIDVGAKYEIYTLMNRLAEDGKCIIMISSELPEALGMSDRILVMRGGRIAGEIADVPCATQEQVMHMAVG